MVLNARDAEARGARIMTRTKVMTATREGDLWLVEVENTETGRRETIKARALVNAGGPWVKDVITGALRQNASEACALCAAAIS